MWALLWVAAAEVGTNDVQGVCGCGLTAVERWKWGPMTVLARVPDPRLNAGRNCRWLCG